MERDPFLVLARNELLGLSWSCSLKLSAIANRRADNVDFKILIDRIGKTPGCDLKNNSGDENG